MRILHTSDWQFVGWICEREHSELGTLNIEFPF